MTFLDGAYFRLMDGVNKFFVRSNFIFIIKISDKLLDVLSAFHFLIHIYDAIQRLFIVDSVTTTDIVNHFFQKFQI